MGFSASANSFAAVVVLLMVIAAGVVIQRKSDGDGSGWITLPILGIAVGFAILISASKTAGATPVLAAGMLGAIAFWREKLAVRENLLLRRRRLLRPRRGRGHRARAVSPLARRRQPDVPLALLGRAARVLAAHPVLGVGWDNFGLRYLAVRMPIAGEEIRDPHNFIVRFFVELGIVGGILCVAWMLRLWWELTRPHVPDANSHTAPKKAIRPILAIVLGATVLNVLATVDFSFASTGGEAGPAFVTIKLFERACGGDRPGRRGVRRRGAPIGRTELRRPPRALGAVRDARGRRRFPAAQPRRFLPVRGRADVSLRALERRGARMRRTDPASTSGGQCLRQLSRQLVSSGSSQRSHWSAP